MIVKDTAKLENADIPRFSSWAYPISWSRSTSPLRVSVDASMPLPASPMLYPLPLRW